MIFFMKKVQKSFLTLFADLPAGSGRDLSEFEEQRNKPKSSSCWRLFAVCVRSQPLSHHRCWQHEAPTHCPCTEASDPREEPLWRELTSLHSSEKPVSLTYRCPCRFYESNVARANIKHLKILSTPNCSLQIVARLKSNSKQVCIDPKLKWIQEYLEKALNKRFKM
uniref:Stromal cell-derived factor 1 n=1 Tax=Taeniopygia guttata TaxID=59729 RepID=A0A674GF76_TAEGU